MTVSEGISWLLQEPKLLERNHCFMTIASRKATAVGLDARTPAIWISGGTGRDGNTNTGAAKVGWCWAGNRHTWLRFASARSRPTGSCPRPSVGPCKPDEGAGRDVAGPAAVGEQVPSAATSGLIC